MRIYVNPLAVNVQRRGNSVCIIKEPKSRPCSAARQFCLYNKGTKISPMLSGEVIQSVQERSQNLADVQRRSNSVCKIKEPKSRRCSAAR